MTQKSLNQSAYPGVVFRELPWLSFTMPLWAAWHRVNLRPLVETFRLILTHTDAEPFTGSTPDNVSARSTVTN
jgi:hypothetical protein